MSRGSGAREWWVRWIAWGGACALVGAWMLCSAIRGRMMRDLLNECIDAIYEHHTLSWIGHGVQGLLFGFVGGWIGLATVGTGMEGLIFTVGAFAHREVDTAFETLRKQGLRAALKKVVEDGAMDLIAPYIGAVVGTTVALIVR